MAAECGGGNTQRVSHFYMWQSVYNNVYRKEQSYSLVTWPLAHVNLYATSTSSFIAHFVNTGSGLLSMSVKFWIVILNSPSIANVSLSTASMSTARRTDKEE